jgi:hypothetical protein
VVLKVEKETLARCCEALILASIVAWGTLLIAQDLHLLGLIYDPAKPFYAVVVELNDSTKVIRSQESFEGYTLERTTPKGAYITHNGATSYVTPGSVAYDYEDVSQDIEPLDCELEYCPEIDDPEVEFIWHPWLLQPWPDVE